MTIPNIAVIPVAGQAQIDVNPALGWAYEDLSNVLDAVFVEKGLSSGLVGSVLFESSGSGDQSAALQTVFDQAVEDGYTVELKANTTIRCDLPLSPPQGLRLNGNGAELDFSGLTATDSSLVTNMRPCMIVRGSVGASAYPLATDATRKGYQAAVTAGQGANFATNDRVILQRDGYYTYDSTVFCNRAEAKIVESKSTDTLSFSTPFDDDYPMSDNAKLYKLTLKTGVQIRGVKFRGHNTTSFLNVAIYARETEGLVVEGCTFNGFDYITVLLAGTNLYPRILNNDITGVRLLTTGNAFYGVAMYGTCQWWQIVGNTGTRLRHLAIASISSNVAGRPRYGQVIHNHAWNMQYGGTLPSYAFEPRYCQFSIWAHNTADGCQSGFMCESGDKIVANNYVKNFRGTGIGMGDTDAGRSMENLSILNNTIETVPGDVGIQTIGIYAPNNVNQTRKNITIRGNNIREYVGASNAYGVRLDPCLLSEGVTVSENKIFGPAIALAPSNAYGVYVQTAGVTVARNTFYGLGNGVAGTTAAEALIVRDNEFIRYEVGTDTRYAINMAGNNGRIFGNLFRGQVRCLALSGNNNRYWNHDATGQTIFLSDSGAGNTGAASHP